MLLDQIWGQFIDQFCTNWMGAKKNYKYIDQSGDTSLNEVFIQNINLMM